MQATRPFAGRVTKGEPRFLENVEMFFNKAAATTSVPKDWLELIR